MGWFKDIFKPRPPKTQKQIEWEKKVDKVVNDFDTRKVDLEKCPSCHGCGISMFGIAIGSMICMKCGGTGRRR